MGSPVKQNPACAEMRVRTVLFDYGLVLTGPPDPGSWAAIRDLSGLSEEVLHEAYWYSRHDYDRGTLNGSAYWNAVAERSSTKFSEPQIAELKKLDVDLWTVPNQPMIAWAQRLQRADVRTGILSNIGDAMSDGITRKLAWLADFSHCTWSHALFLAKPEPEIYRRTAELLGTPPQHILFIDDRIENIETAKAIGMHAIRYTTQQEFEREMHDCGYGTLLDIGLVPASASMQPA